MSETAWDEGPSSKVWRNYGIWLTGRITDEKRRETLIERIGCWGNIVTRLYPSDPRTGDRSYRFDQQKLRERLVSDGLMTADEFADAPEQMRMREDRITAIRAEIAEMSESAMRDLRLFGYYDVTRLCGSLGVAITLTIEPDTSRPDEGIASKLSAEETP